MVKSYYIYRDTDYYIYGSNIITFIVSTLLHYGWFVLHLWWVLLILWLVLHLWLIITFLGEKTRPHFRCKLMCLSQYPTMNALSQPLFFKHPKGLRGGVWVLIQFHRCLDSREFVFLLNWSQATVSVVPWQVHNSRGAKWVFTSALANDISYLSVNRSKLSDGPVLGLHQIGKKGKRKLVRSSNTVNVRKRIWPNYRHLLQISLCLELKGTFFILLMSSWKIEFIAF